MHEVHWQNIRERRNRVPEYSDFREEKISERTNREIGILKKQ